MTKRLPTGVRIARELARTRGLLERADVQVILDALRPFHATRPFRVLIQDLDAPPVKAPTPLP